jgi:2-polyprenyl-6-methoxyphenol hydroxylase-like FAD-dependent oxidoreductase
MKTAMTDDPAVQILICGAGAAGLTLAIELARRGVSFRLIERMAGPFHGSRGKGIQPRTLEVFEDLGIVNRIACAGGPYPPQREYRADGTFIESEVVEQAKTTPGEPYPLPWMVPQFLTEGVLRERLGELGQQVAYRTELVGLRQDSDGVTAQLMGKSGEERVRVQYLIGADGGRSFVRQSLGIGFPGKTLGVRAIVADLSLTGLDRLAWHRFNEGSMERQLSLCPLAGTEFFQIQAPSPLEGEVDLSAEGLGAIVAERSGRRDIGISSVSWVSAFQMNARLADQYRVGRVFLVGDAAHVHPPTGGQGLNTSIQDAYNLAWKLAATLAGAPEALLASYEDERRPVAASVLGMSTRLLAALQQGDSRRGREVRQLDLSYPDSPLNLQSPDRRRAPTAGDRAPDAPMRGAAGAPIRLFELFKGIHWTLLSYECDRRRSLSGRPNLHMHRIGTGGDLVDAYGHFRETYAVEAGTWVLVRPDGYVGAMVGSDGIDALEGYLRKVGLSAREDIRGMPR